MNGSDSGNSGMQKYDEQVLMFNRFVESSGQALGITDLQGRMTYVNATLCRILGEACPEDIYRKDLFVYYLPEHVQRLKEEILPVVMEHDQWVGELSLVDIQGHVTPTIHNIFLLRDDRGEPKCIAGVVTDISSRIHLEQELRAHQDQLENLVSIRTAELEKSNAHLRDRITKHQRTEKELLRLTAILDRTSDLVGLSSPDGLLSYLNAACRRVAGFGDDENLCGLNISNVHPDRAWRIVSEEGIPAAKTRGVWAGETAIVNRDGREIPVSQVIMAHHAPDGSLEYLSTIMRDITEHKRMDEALRQSEERYRRITENMNDLLVELDAQGILKYVSPSHRSILGYDSEELVGSSAFDGIHPEDREQTMANYMDGVRREADCEAEYRYRCKDGTYLWVHSSGHPLFGSDGKHIGFIISSHDVTDRKKAEEALQESETNYRRLFNNAPAAIYQVDFRTGKYLKANEIVCEFFGCTQKEITSLSPADLLTDQSKQLFAQRLRKISLGEPVTDTPEYEFIDESGKHRWLQLNVKNIYDSEGLMIGADVVAHEITERKQAEEALQEAQRRLSDIIEFFPDATMVIDREGKVTAWNRAMEAMTGVRAEEMLGKGNYEYALPFYGERRPILIDLALRPDPEKEKAYTSIQRTNDTIMGEAYTPALATGMIHMSATASVLRDSKGEIIAAIECVRNNTERKKMEERLQRSEKMESLGVLAGGVAHDLNNLLGVLVGYSELLLQETTEGSRTEKYAKSILQGGERAAAIIQDLLTMARRGVAVSDTVNLNQILAASLKTPEYELMRSHYPDVVFQSHVEKDLFNIKGSPVHLSKTIMNLMSNAAEAIQGAGVVMVTTENRYVDVAIKGYENTAEGEYVVLTVTDTGSGISPTDMGRIFEPFYTKKMMGRSGTGLGLAVVWGTVKDHGGYIDVRTEKNKGSTFTLYFPVVREALSEKDQASSPDSYSGCGESILIVDDVEAQSSLAAAILEKLNYQVATVASGEKAIEYLMDHHVDLMVLDMIMEPGIDGLETYRRILKIQPHQKAIIVSGYAKTERINIAQKLGAGEYVRKPYIIEKLAMAVRKELDRKR